jgi:phytoene synthase
MDIPQIYQDIFKAGSTTYFNSSIFFPKDVRLDVFILYGFVRVADDYVDTIPQKREDFLNFCDLYEQAYSGKKVEGDKRDVIIIENFVDLMKRKDFKPEWVDAFLHSMEMDLSKKIYNSLDETLEYIYGSAEVIGLFMAKILELPDESYFAAERLGRAMQYINFIRDINQDMQLGRQYFSLKEYDLKNLTQEEAMAHQEEFKRFLRDKIEQYFGWQEEAEEGFKHIRRRYWIPIKTASDMYKWTANQIKEDPFIVYEEKVKPSKGRIIRSVIKNTFKIRK